MARRSASSAHRRSPASARTVGRRFRRTRIALWLNVALAVLLGGWYLLQPPARQAEVRQLLGNTFADNKRVDLADVAWDLYQLYYSPDYVAAPPVAGDRTHLYAGLPVSTDPEVRVTRVLTNTGYVVGYDDNIGDPRWAAYRLADLSPLPAPAERPDRFEVDRRTLARIDSDTYTDSGYDRGHLAPNYAIATRYGAAAQQETFLMSNVIPQKHGLNAGLWKQLELRIATAYPARFGEVWVLAGPIFSTKPAYLPGRSRQSPRVPAACYMIVVDESDGRVRAAAFIFPQDPPATAQLSDYLTSIDEIEYRTGLDFLADLPDDAETALEAKPASRVW